RGRGHRSPQTGIPAAVLLPTRTVDHRRLRLRRPARRGRETHPRPGHPAVPRRRLQRAVRRTGTYPGFDLEVWTSVLLVTLLRSKERFEAGCVQRSAASSLTWWVGVPRNRLVGAGPWEMLRVSSRYLHSPVGTA